MDNCIFYQYHTDSFTKCQVPLPDMKTDRLVHFSKCNASHCCYCETDKIKALSQRTVNWISVNDRLPKIDGWYLIFSENGQQHVDLFCSIDNNFYDAFVYGYNVTHWTQLPKPPPKS